VWVWDRAPFQTGAQHHDRQARPIHLRCLCRGLAARHGTDSVSDHH
jgi:hypothetical protein